jgi:hypothetical protein
MPTPMALVSVMPQPVPGRALGKVAAIARTCSGARAAPPPPTWTRLLRSLPAARASTIRSPVTAGGPTKLVARSASISAAARSASHLYIEITRRWARNEER